MSDEKHEHDEHTHEQKKHEQDKRERHKRERGEPRQRAHRVASGGDEQGVEAVAGEAVQPIADDVVAGLTAQRDEYLDNLRRLQAEFDNYRKRVRRESEELRLRAAEDVVESLLPVMDNMARALEAAAHHEEGQLVGGLQLVAGQLNDVLAAYGLARVPTAVGDPFDPTVHEAVMTQSSDDHDEGVVLQVLEPGYLLHGRLLRPAKVVVAR
ncbi:MAG TPA: nucleotide exchange factor GrpE [Thermoleophilia bacterium]|nr:nucleotide exchange factor GrpE [Thermoleophilia bacterium]HQG03902.1 nucleotide exchange factor GrpE [Thermoleophilia bacterium]HQJ97956.1 nucleotide exchange factor GrpE [Thermoleophilia bacterium]